MKKVQIKINPAKKTSYPIFIGENLLDNVYSIIQQYTSASKFLIVTNETIYPLWGDKLKNKNSEFIILPDGEVYKNMDILNKIIDKALEIKLERKDAIIALGGGVCGDIAGFAASIYQRGIDFIQIPTTLLAQVDSSVGGKVAVNHKSGKNMIGSFYQPKAVIADINTLLTLDNRQFKTGLSEVLKYAFIENSCGCRVNFNFFHFLNENSDEIISRDTKVLRELVKICCTLKGCVVNQDEKEKGLRAILNFGHTYAHAIENLTEYKKYTHGEAVSIGMKFVFDLSLRLNLINEKYYQNCINLINKYNLKTELDIKFSKDKFYEAMHSDKKVSGGKINFVLPVIGNKVEIKNNIDKNIVVQGI